jgi:hypothetical protein
MCASVGLELPPPDTLNAFGFDSQQAVPLGVAARSDNLAWKLHSSVRWNGLSRPHVMRHDSLLRGPGGCLQSE